MNIVKAREELLFGKSIYDMKLRVVDYGRVSTDKEDQINSLENQVKFFNDYIEGISNWTHVASYVDEGISGTQVNNREQFLKMIDDAKNDKIDLVLTKEVSRFARNTIDSIHFTELLLSYGVIVFFISDNINTIYKDSEFRLTLMASMAQDEVRKLSERVKFGIKRSIKDGKLGGSSLYGYKKKDCKLIINDDEAAIVRLIFSLYSEGEYGLRKICDILKSKNILTRRGKYFSDSTLKKMIKNPRYKGFFTANLSEVVDYKTHKRKINKEEDKIIYKDKSIPKIVDEDTWNKANKILKERNSKWNKNIINKSTFLEKKSYTSKIICLEHNKSFIRSASSKRKNNPVWQCNEYLRHGLKSCMTPRLYEKRLDIEFSKILSNIIDVEKIGKDLIEDYSDIIKNNYCNLEINKKIKKIELFKERLLDLYLRKIISEKDFINKKNKIENDIFDLEKINKNNDLKALLPIIKREIASITCIKDNIGKFFNIFIEKVYISKINDNRKHIKMQIIFSYKRDNLNIEIFI